MTIQQAAMKAIAALMSGSRFAFGEPYVGAGSHPHGKRSTTVAAMKRDARKRRNIRARRSKR